MSKRVLIADDSTIVRNVVRGFLEDVSDIEVCAEARDGLDTIKKAEQCKPDLVVLDLAMPKMNGGEVASALKMRMPLTKIILFTMYSENIGRYVTSKVAIDAVLTKAGGMQKLVDCVRTLLP